MANTYTLITSTTLTSGSSVSFTSIPSSYTDLLINVSAKGTYNAGGGSLSFAINFNNTASGYSSKYIQSYSATSVTSGSDTTTTLGGVTGGLIRAMAVSSNGTTTTNVFSNCQVYIPNYAGSTYKSYSVDACSEDNAGSASSANSLCLTSGLWSNTAAIDRIDFGIEVSTFVSPTTIYLYGIKNS